MLDDLGLHVLDFGCGAGERGIARNAAGRARGAAELVVWLEFPMRRARFCRHYEPPTRASASRLSMSFCERVGPSSAWISTSLSPALRPLPFGRPSILKRRSGPK